MTSSQITTSGGSVWCLPSCLSVPHGPWWCGPSQGRSISRCRVQLESNIYEWNVCVREPVSHHMTVFITSRATCITIIWFELSIFSLPSTKSLLHYCDEDENTQFKYPLGRDPWRCSLHRKEGWVSCLGSQFGTLQAFDLRHHHWQYTRTSLCYLFLQEDPRTSS